MSAERGAQLARRAVAVVGERLHDDRHAGRPIALVAHLLVLFAAVGARATLDGTLDRLFRHVSCARRDHGGAQARIGRGIRQARARRHRQFANQLGERLGALCVLRALAVHDVLELRMTGHNYGSTLGR